jgi:hypothetical protein
MLFLTDGNWNYPKTKERDAGSRRSGKGSP